MLGSQDERMKARCWVEGGGISSALRRLSTTEWEKMPVHWRKYLVPKPQLYTFDLTSLS